MTRTAKLFKNGWNQAVRLPRDFRFEGEAVYIRKDPQTGDVILSTKPNVWDDFFALVAKCDVPADFMDDRQAEAPQIRDLF